MKAPTMAISHTTTDKSIRIALLEYLAETHSASDTAIISEFALSNCSARIDIAVVNGEMHGYELKSDSDSLKRLAQQVEAYNLIFDRVTLVVGKKHLVESLSFIPDWWGITVAKITSDTHNTLLLPIRHARTNPSQDIRSIVNLLWKSEAVELLKTYTNLDQGERMKKEIVCNNLIGKIEIKNLKKHVRYQLFTRFTQTTWRSVV